MPDLLIRGGRIVTPSGIVEADVSIDDRRITALAQGLPSAKQNIDATGLLIFPGLIDPHLHFNEPGHADWEGAETGSRALAAGGGTLFFDMPLNSTPCTVNARHFDAKRDALEQSSITNFALWGGLVPGNLQDMAELADRGVVGFKAFLCDSGLPEFPRADDLTLFEGMKEAAKLRLPVAVHAESDEITGGLTRRLLASGQNDIAAFLESRPVLAEVEAIARAALLAREAKCRLHIVHISSGKGVAAALEARALGTDISIETCPHYLFFTEYDLLRMGAIAKCAPPLRPVPDRETLWRWVLEGAIDVIASDHSPCPPAMKDRDNFFQIWGGIAGVQSTFSVMMEEGHQSRALPMVRLADLISGFAARRFGIEGRGEIRPGNHADLFLVDPQSETTLEASNLFQLHRISPYVGYRFRGEVKQTLLGGETIFSGGKFASNRKGRLVRPTPQEVHQESHAATRSHS